MSSNPVLRGVVVKADKYAGTGKGFGYAFVGFTGDPDYPCVFIHVSRCRRVTGTSHEPDLTDERATATLTDAGDATRIVMEVRQGPRGPEAVRWGVIPDTDYVAEFARSGKLDRYVGGHIGIHYSHDLRGDGWINGRLEAFVLEPGKLTLHVRRNDHPAHDYEFESFISYIECPYERRDSRAVGEPPNMGNMELGMGSPRITVYLHPPTGT